MISDLVDNRLPKSGETGIQGSFSMSMIDVIEKKRDGGELSTDQIFWFIRAYTAGEIPDYQAAALIMAIYIQGMNRRETVDLTTAMAESGDQIDLHDVVPFVVDKHSSGGVGDKTSLVVLPAVAACCVPVGKMSGRGLGSSGGTLDKMESIPGWSPNLTIQQFKKQLADIDLVLSGQTAKLAPADKKLYALRDVTGTIGSKPLIAASIMSKKLACWGDAVVLDVKLGNGAFMPTVDEARELAELMVGIGKDAGRKTVALLSDMNQPLGYAVGNSLEVREAIEALRGYGPPDLWTHCLEVAGYMVLLSGQAQTLDEAKDSINKVRADGRALAKFREMVAAQGGDVHFVDNPESFLNPAIVEQVLADRGGYISGIDAGAIGWSCVRLGAGRMLKSDSIDHSVGMEVPIKVGDQIEQGDLLGTVYAPDQDRSDRAREEFRSSISISDSPVSPLPHLHGTLT
jgi:pyrimidine-nucleoside phosphorylase